MPFKSEAQRRFMHARHPELADEFEAKTPKGKKLPEHVEKTAKEQAFAQGVKSLASDVSDVAHTPQNIEADLPSAPPMPPVEGKKPFQFELATPEDIIEPEEQPWEMRGAGNRGYRVVNIKGDKVLMGRQFRAMRTLPKDPEKAKARLIEAIRNTQGGWVALPKDVPLLETIPGFTKSISYIRLPGESWVSGRSYRGPEGLHAHDYEGQWFIHQDRHNPREKGKGSTKKRLTHLRREGWPGLKRWLEAPPPIIDIDEATGRPVNRRWRGQVHKFTSPEWQPEAREAWRRRRREELAAEKEQAQQQAALQGALAQQKTSEVRLAALFDELEKIAMVSVGPPPKRNRKEWPYQGTITFRGLLIMVENRKGSYREWTDDQGKTGRTKMHHHYGEVRRTLGPDGDPVDVYVGPDDQSDVVYVVHQMKTPNFKEYDEDKCMLGFRTAKEAKQAYLQHYDDKRFFGSMTTMSFDDFRKLLRRRDVRGKKITEALIKTGAAIPLRYPSVAVA